MTSTAQRELGGEAGMENRSQETAAYAESGESDAGRARTGGTAWPLLAHRPPRTPCVPRCLPRPTERRSRTPRALPRGTAQPPAPNFLLQPSTETHRTVPRLLTRQNNTLLMMKSAAPAFVDFCRNFAGERMVDHDSKLVEWHLIFSKPSSDFS